MLWFCLEIVLMNLVDSMAALLSKFRIDYSKLTLIPDITRRAHSKTQELFDSLIRDYTVRENKGTEMRLESSQSYHST